MHFGFDCLTAQYSCKTEHSEYTEVNRQNNSTACVTNAGLSGAIFVLKNLSLKLRYNDKIQLQDKGHNSKSYSFGVMPLVLP